MLTPHHPGLMLTQGKLKMFPAASLVNLAEDTKCQKIHPLTRDVRPGEKIREKIGKEWRKLGRKKGQKETRWAGGLCYRCGKSCLACNSHNGLRQSNDAQVYEPTSHLNPGNEPNWLNTPVCRHHFSSSLAYLVAHCRDRAVLYKSLTL